MLRPAPNVVRESEGVFLGVILDEHLYMSWKSHISYLSSKVSRSMGNIYKSRSIKLLPTQTCSTYTLSTYLILVRRLVLLQKQAIRMIIPVNLFMTLIPAQYCRSLASRQERLWGAGILLPQDFCRTLKQCQEKNIYIFFRIPQSLSWRPTAGQRALRLRDCCAL